MAFAKLLIAGLALSSLIAMAEPKLWNSSKIHELMTEDEIRAIFNTDIDSVPDYEVVAIHQKPPSTKGEHGRRAKRSYGTDMRLKWSDKEVQLYLEENDHVLFGKNTPVWAAVSDEDSPFGIKYKPLKDVWPETLKAYQDLANKAALVMEKAEDGRIMSIDGLLEFDTVIKSLPMRLRKSRLSGGNDDYMNHHYVFKFKKPSLNFFEDDDSFFKDNFKSHNFEYKNIFPDDGWFKNKDWKHEKKVPNNNNNNYIPKKKKLEVVYPEIQVIVDFETYKAHGKDPKAMARYMAAFWNAVDLRYRAFASPRVRLNIARLIIATDKGAVYYMSNHQMGKDLMDHSGAFSDLSGYLSEDERFDPKEYDLTVAITRLDMCTKKRSYYSSCDKSIRGIAFMTGVCKHEAGGIDMAVALMEDNANFDGVIVAAHEIGHLLGAPHDGEESARHCKWNGGYLMSSVADGMQWSECSKEAIGYYLNNYAHCLHNRPKMSQTYPKYLPGKLMSRQQQCNMINMVECLQMNQRNECTQLWCMRPRDYSGRCYYYSPPAEGSSCGRGGVCLDGLCVKESNDVSDDENDNNEFSSYEA